MEIPGSEEKCATCGILMQGKYCHGCGEKHLDPRHDFSALHFLEETFESFTHLDSRVIRSFRYLFTRPGFLTAEFLAGRRVPYLKPVPFFLVAGVVFYLLFPNAYAFFSRPEDMSQAYQLGNRVANTLSIDTPTLIAQKSKALGLGEEVFVRQAMEQHASPNSKTWLFLMIPAWGFFLWLFFWRRVKWFVPNMIFALHGLSFFILFDILSLGVLKLMGFKQLGDSYILYLFIVMTTYCVLAVRRVYGLGRLASVLAGLGASFLFFCLLNLYRQLITVWTLWMA